MMSFSQILCNLCIWLSARRSDPLFKYAMIITKLMIYRHNDVFTLEMSIININIQSKKRRGLMALVYKQRVFQQKLLLLKKYVFLVLSFLMNWFIRWIKDFIILNWLNKLVFKEHESINILQFRVENFQI